MIQSSVCGYIKPLLLLGNCYYYGKGTRQDLNKAMECYHRAFLKGSIEAQRIIEVIYNEK